MDLDLAAMKASVEHIRAKLALAERRACRLLLVPVSSYCYKPRQSDNRLRERLVALAREKPRFGYRRLLVLLGCEREIYEVSRLRELPLSLPLPTDKALVRRCLKFSASPKAKAKIDDWARSLHLTRRTFTRLFRRETGLSFVAWRQQACLLAALPKLMAGTSVTQTAADLGYENPAAFSTLFKRSLSVAPREYIQSIDRSWEGSTRPPTESDL